MHYSKNKYFLNFSVHSDQSIESHSAVSIRRIYNYLRLNMYGKKD